MSFLEFGSFSVAGLVRPLKLNSDSFGPLIRNPRGSWIRIPAGSPVFSAPHSYSFLLKVCKGNPFSPTDVHALDSLSAHNPPQWLPGSVAA